MYKSDKDKKSFYNSSAWKKLRQVKLSESNNECEMCKEEGRATVDSIKVEGQKKEVVLNVHHKHEIEDYPKLALYKDNLQVLCLHHHNVVHDRVFKGNNRKGINLNEEFPEKW